MIYALVAYFLTFAVAAWLAACYFIHMFQLEAYLKKQYLKWVKTELVKNIIPKMIPMFVFAVVLMFNSGITTFALLSVLNLLCCYIFRPKKAKKAFVYTARVKRLLTTTVLLNFVVLIPASVFGLYFIFPIIFVLSELVILLAAYINDPVEKAVRNKYINEAKRIISARKKNLTVIGITGSYGKTSTKFFLAKILSKKYNVFMTPASYNTTMGVVKAIREMLKPTHEIFICEMGARNTGEIKEICDIVLPDYGIITSVGPQHLETFKTIENVIKTKFELFDAVKDKQKVFLNADNSYIYEKASAENSVFYGINNKSAAYVAENITCSSSGTDFVLNMPCEKLNLSTRLLGEHNVLNIAACCAVAHKLGVDSRDIAISVRMLEPVEHRLQMFDGGDVVIIDDSFNSNPSGAKAALDVLSKFDGTRILVTPGMIELGEKQEELNRAFGAQAAKVCDYIYIVGKVNYNAIAEGITSGQFDVENRLFAVSSPEQAVNMARMLQETSKKYVLLENDLPDNFR